MDMDIVKEVEEKARNGTLTKLEHALFIMWLRVENKIKNQKASERISAAHPRAQSILADWLSKTKTKEQQA